MQSNSVFEPIAIYQAVEVKSLTLRKLSVSAEAQAVQKVTMVMLDVIERSFVKQKKKFSNWENLIKTIRKAMQGRYLSSIEIFGFCGSERVLSLKISIDWTNLRVLAEGADFKPLNPSLPPLKQVDEAISVIVSLLGHEVENRKIDSFRSMFVILSSSSEENQQRSSECGLTDLSPLDIASLERFRQKAIGHSVSSPEVPGAVFRVLYVDSPIVVESPSLISRIKAFFT